MPRITFTTDFAIHDNAGMPDTRIIAQTKPSRVENNREPIVTTIVSPAPCSRIGRNSADRGRKDCIVPPLSRRRADDYSSPHLARIFCTDPSAFSLASEVLIFCNNSPSVLRTPIPTEPTTVGLYSFTRRVCGKLPCCRL